MQFAISIRLQFRASYKRTGSYVVQLDGLVIFRDAGFEVEVSPRKVLSKALKSAASASPRSRCFYLASTRGIGTSKLRYDIIIHNLPPFILYIDVIQAFETKLHLCIKPAFIDAS